MSAISLVASIVVGVAFVVAGASKLAAGRGWPEQARELGVPRAAALLVPWVELAVGALLVVQLAEPWPAVTAVVLLLAFSALIVWHLAGGRHPPCACFGAWSAKPIGAVHLLRNGVLIVAAVVALLQ